MLLQKNMYPTALIDSTSKNLFSKLSKNLPFFTNFLPKKKPFRKVFIPLCNLFFARFSNIFIRNLRKCYHFSQTFCQNGMLLQKNMHPTALIQLARFGKHLKKYPFSQTFFKNFMNLLKIFAKIECYFRKISFPLP